MPLRSLLAALVLAVVASPSLAAADAAISHPTPTNSYILVGFAGGFERHDNPRHGPVQLAHQIQSDLPSGSSIQVFENRHRKDAYNTILRRLDSNHDGVLSSAEKSQARIILFGHSWGASAVVMLARELNPENVVAAVNFYQPHGLLHGRKRITAANDSKTQILGNYRFDYRKTPVWCPGATWFQRNFSRSHMQSQCDPGLWSQVEALVRQRLQPKLEPQPATVAALPQP